MDVLIDGEIVLYGAVGADCFGDGFAARDVVNALAMLGRSTPVNVRLNSGGGYTDDGVAIYNALKTHAAPVTVYIDGVAASAATIIAMAGASIVMRKGAVMMIHDPSTISFGTARDHAKSIEMLEATASSMAEIYADRTGRPIDEIRSEMAEEIWMNADQAKAKKFVDRVDESASIDPVAFNYGAYRHAPDRIMAFSADAAVAARNSSSNREQRNRKSEVATPADKQGPQTMTDQNEQALAAAREEAAAAAQARVAAILDSEAAKGRETLARHFAFKTVMTTEDALAALSASPVEKSAAAASPSIGSRATETFLPGAATVDTGEHVNVASTSDLDRRPAQKGAVPWSQISAKLNAEFKRNQGAGR